MVTSLSELSLISVQHFFTSVLNEVLCCRPGHSLGARHAVEEVTKVHASPGPKAVLISWVTVVV